MKKVIYKYTLDVRDEQFVEMPRGAKLLAVGVQHGEVRLWAEVTPSRSNGSAKIRMFATGEPMEYGSLEYIGTFQLSNGQFVFHVYGASPV